MPLNLRRDIRFRSKPEERLDEFNFIGGLVKDAHETKLEPFQSPNLANVAFNETGSIKTRNGYTRYNGTPIGATSSISNFGTSTGSLSTTTASSYVAQSFIPGSTIVTLQVDLSLAMANSGEEQLARVELWQMSGGEPAQILTGLSKSQILLVSGTSEATYSFRFSTPISLTNGTTYALVLRPYVRGSAQTVNQINVHHTANDYANGTVFTTPDGVEWTADSAKDLKFRVYSGGNTGGTGLIRFYGDGGVKQLIAKFGSSLYRGNDSTGSMTSMTLGSGSTLNADNFIDWTITNGTLLVVDNNGYIQKYRGSTNSNYSTGTIAVSNGSAIVTGSGTSWNTSTNVEAGEYIKLPDSKWYKITGVGSDTSLTVETAYLGTSSSGQSYTISPWGEVHGKLSSATAVASLVRPTPHFIENHANRIWTLSGNRLRWSALDTSVEEEHFNDWDTSNNAGEVIIPSGKGDSGTGLYSLGNALIVFQRRSIWAIYGTSPATFELRNITHEVGMIDKRSLVEYNDLLIFLSDKGVYFFDGSNTRNVSDGVVNRLIDSWASKGTAVATLWDNSYIISYAPSGQTYASESLVLDLTRNIWGRMTGMYASAWSVWGGATDNGEIYFASSNQGSIYRWDTGGNDDGYEIYTLYETPSLGLGMNVNDKTIKKFYLQQLAKGDYNMTVTALADLSTSGTTSEINLIGGSVSLWDVAEWDENEFSGEGEIITTRIAEFQGIAKFFKFRIEQEGYNEGIEALGITVTQRTRRLT